jgi:2-polyprenyl-3-methyl-5-hydroxy-6-metoxy-1,4-benzoquinol methylase
MDTLGKNTTGEDLDLDNLCFSERKQDVVTAFEIFEHLLNPYTILSEIKSDKDYSNIYSDAFVVFSSI